MRAGPDARRRRATGAPRRRGVGGLPAPTGPWILALSCAAALLLPSALAAQAAWQTSRAAEWSPGTDLRDLTLGAVGSLIVVALDDEIRGVFLSEGARSRVALRSLSDGVEPLGARGPQFATLGMAAAGHLAGWPTLAEVGEHIGGGLAFSGAATRLLKATVGRARPVTAGGDPTRFFAEGSWVSSGGLHSFPSGHTTAAFALATGISEELRIHRPEIGRYATPGLYAVAGLVGLSRVYGDKHWGSDVLMGGVVGTVLARSWIRGAHRHDSGRRIVPTVLTGPDGATGLGIRWVH